MTYKFFFAIIITYLLSPKSAHAAPDSMQLNYDTLAQKISERQFEYNTLSLHSKMSYDDGTSQQDFAASIRMLKDSLIWISISGAMGVEAARVLITPDTFCIINKLDGSAELHGFDFVQKWLLFPVSFKMLQQIIAGQQLDIQQRAGMAALSDSFSIIYAESEKLLEKIWVNNANYTLAKILLKDKLITQDLTVTFDNYNEQAAMPGKPFSLQRQISVNRNGIALSLTIETSKVKVNEAQTYPFEISNKNKRRQK
jgi:hypothetical protein